MAGQIRSGKPYGNRVGGVQTGSEKLRGSPGRIISIVTGLEYDAPEMPRHQPLLWTVPHFIHVGPVATSQLERVFEATGGDDANSCSALLNDGVDGDRRAMNELIHRRRRNRKAIEPLEDLSRERGGTSRVFLDHEAPISFVE